MKITIFETPTHALIYARCMNKESTVHLTTDGNWNIYIRVRKECPSKVILFDTRKDLKFHLEKMNYFL